MTSPVPIPAQGTSPSAQPHTPEVSHQVQHPLRSAELIKLTPAQSILEMKPTAEVGVQEWPNGWRYEGEFQGNLKHGHGLFQWANGEYYIGQFYKDHRHGNGTYIWPDGTKFTGMFYLDRKDGYGTLEMKDGSIFQGLYKADERFGPGVLTYPNGRQDVGLWYRNHLIRLCTAIPGAFTMKNYPAYQSDTKEYVVLIKAYKEKYFWRTDPKEDPFFYPYKKFLFDDNYTLPAEIETYSNDADHLPLTRSYRREGDRYFFQEEELVDEDHTDQLTSINRTPLLVKIQIHIHRHRHAQAKLLWNVAAVIEGKREDFGPKGPLECSSEQLIIAAGEGNHEKVRKILETKLVSADVADVQGHTSLINASIFCKRDIINLLLDDGANVNKLNNEGVSALNSSCILYYPSSCFLHNEIYRLINKKAKPSIGRASRKKESVDELPKQVKIAKRISVYDRNIRLGSISFKQLESISLLTDHTSKEKYVNVMTEQEEEEQILNFEESLLEENTNSETDDDIESLVSPSAGPPSTANFESLRSVHHYNFNVSEQHLQRAANVLSKNQHFKTGKYLVPDVKHDEKIWRIAAMKSEHRRRRGIIKLLLRRGADPNNSINPMPPLFLSMLAGDLSTVKSLLENKADPNMRLESQIKEMKGLPAIHVGVAIPGKKGVMITNVLLNAGANPDVAAEDGDEIYEPDKLPEPEMLTGFVLKSPNQFGVPPHYHTPTEIIPKEDGRTPLHIACQREDNYKHAHQIVRELLRHKADPNVLWNGHSPLSLAIASGNDLDVKIAQTPYHALTPDEREIYNARRHLLNFLSKLFQRASIAKERKRLDGIIEQNLRSQEPSDRLQLSESEALSLAEVSRTAKAIFERNAQIAEGNLPSPLTSEKKSRVQDTIPRRQLFKFKFCYYCGRSVGVRLITCTRCKEVYYCSKACKMTAWNEYHKDECYVSKGRAPKKRKDELEGLEGTVGTEGTEGRGLLGEDAMNWSLSSSSSVELDNYSYN
ncbi:ankyrin repeat and MYND domain-containing protein 1 isoform X2 [Heterodontus francisci]|uniref:ankyrin repeat and MYND domain-containing protein 1 isoform X2 n=1 Tax=Heterodontus francisci TaxID=7792 RepID=UPI00355BD8F0